MNNSAKIVDKIIRLIDSFFIDFNSGRLYLLDNILLGILFQKEDFVLKGEKAKAKNLESIISRYSDYRNLILKKGKKIGLPEDFLIKKIFFPPSRLIALVTHNCQLRCSYCSVRKFPAVMDEKILFKAIDLLFTSDRKDIQLQFFGGEPLLCYELIKKGVNYAEKINKIFKKNLSFLLTTNGIELTKEKVDFFKKHKFTIECSCDGQEKSQLQSRKAANGLNYYSIVLENFRYLFNSGIPHYSISVVKPDNVGLMFENIKYLIKTGFKSLQVNYSLGSMWPEAEIEELFRQTRKILAFLKKRKDVEIINLTSQRREPVVLNSELVVDCDGDIYSESGMSMEEDFQKMKRLFLITDLKKEKNINLHATTPFYNFYRLSEVYGRRSPELRKIILNNIILGGRYNNYLKSFKKNERKSI